MFWERQHNSTRENAEELLIDRWTIGEKLHKTEALATKSNKQAQPEAALQFQLWLSSSARTVSSARREPAFQRHRGKARAPLHPRSRISVRYQVNPGSIINLPSAEEHALRRMEYKSG